LFIAVSFTSPYRKYAFADGAVSRRMTSREPGVTRAKRALTA
jgi:hypothetical protein